MYVVLLNDYAYVQGGATRVAVDEAIGLANRGARVKFIGAVGPVCSDLGAPGVETICLGQSGLKGSGAGPEAVVSSMWNARAYATTKAVLAALDPRETVVHVHQFDKALSTSPVRCALERGFTVVCTLHEYFSVCPNGAFFDYNANVPCYRKALSASCILHNCDRRKYSHKLYRVARSLVQRGPGRMPGGVTHFIASSERCEKMVAPYLPPDAQVHHIENPVIVNRIKPVAVGKNRRIAAVGRLEQEKGIVVLLEAARRTNTALLLVGDGSLRALVSGCEFCEVTGWLPRNEVLGKLESARCLVFPSLCFETYGLSVAEAAGRGIPAIVSDVTAAAERVVNNETGWHVRAGDVGHLQELLGLVQDDTVVDSAGRAAFERFWSNPPTLERHVRELGVLYEEVLRE